MQKMSAGSENLIGVGGSTKDGAAKIWGQLVVGLLRNFKNRILGGWLSLQTPDNDERTIERSVCKIPLPQHAIIAGDFNAHHQWWNSAVKTPK